MRRTFASLALFSAALCCSRANADEKKPMDGSVHRMKKAQVIDRSGFDHPLPAMSMLIPTDWKLESSVVYGQAPCGGLFSLSFNAQSPDGQTGFQLFPAYSWQWADAPQSRQFMQAGNQQNAQFHRGGCDVIPTMNAADFITKMLIPKVRPGAKVMNAEHMPDAHEQIMKQNQQMQQQMNQIGLRGKVTMDDARVHIAYTHQGAAVEEWLTAVITVHATPSPVFQNGRMMPSTMYQEEAKMLFAMRAPAGQLEANKKLFQLIFSTLRIEPDWGQRVGQVQQNIQAINQKGVADRQAIQHKSQEDVARIRNETITHQQEAQDQQHHAFSQYLRDVETYKDPNTGERVELSNQYGHAWSNGNGEYILSESPNYNPNAHANGNWTQLEQVPAQ